MTVNQKGIKMSEKSEHDIRELDSGAQRLSEIIDRLQDDRERLTELIDLWRRPGWTTPAEFFFTRLTLNSLVDQAAALHAGIENFQEGVRSVGR